MDPVQPEIQLTNSKLPFPEFQVDCLMCGTTFSATADTLEELVEIVATHLKQVMNNEGEPHKEYVHKHGEEYQASSLLKHFPKDPRAILRSPGFKWNVLRLVPFKKIEDVVNDPLVQSILPHRAQRTASMEEAPIPHA